ncbi:zinc-binding dehydrogenase, partial [Planctomycetota bacterium]
GGQPEPPLPHTLGSDGAGVVEEEGEGVTGLKGTEVLLDPSLGCGHCERCRAGEASECDKFGILGESRAGTFAEYLVCPASSCYPKPPGMSFEAAAAFGLTSLTAYRMLFTRGRLQAGEDVLIHGVGGGVSTSALVLSQAAGARAIVTSSSDDKLRKAHVFGAHAGINYVTTPKVARAVLELTDGRGVDLVVDSTGKATWRQSLKALRKGGRLVTCGATTGGDPPADIQTIFWKQLSILGSTMGSPGDMRAVVRLAHQGLARPIIDQSLPFSEAVSALRLLEQGEQFGKIVLTI